MTRVELDLTVKLLTDRKVCPNKYTQCSIPKDCDECWEIYLIKKIGVEVKEPNLEI